MFHDDPKINDMLKQMIDQREPYRLIYRWIANRQLGFREFADLMQTYERMIRN